MAMAKKLTITPDMMKEVNQRIEEKIKKGEMKKTSQLYAESRPKEEKK